MGEQRAAIWIAEADEALRDELVSLLGTGDYQTWGFGSGQALEDALDALGPGGQPPSLVVVGLGTPTSGYQGLDVELLRRLGGRGTEPVLAMVEGDSQSAMLSALEAGAADLIRKPFGVPEVVARIAWLLRRDEQIRALRQESDDMLQLTRLARDVGGQQEPELILAALLDLIQDMLQVELAVAYLLEPHSGQLRRALSQGAATGTAEVVETLELDAVEGLRGPISRGQPVCVAGSDLPKLLWPGGGGPGAEGGSAALFPMRGASQELVGVMVLLDRRRETLGAQGRDRSIGALACGLAAVAMERAELWAQLQRDRLEAERLGGRMAEARDLLQSVIRACPDAIVAADLQGRIQVFNPAAERILGYSQAEALGMDVRLLYPPGGAAEIMRRLRASPAGHVGRDSIVRVELVAAGGERIPVSISAALTRHVDQPTGTVGVFSDLRERLAMQHELQETQDHLEQSRQKAMMAELAGAAAHELNQPLTSLLSYAELLRAEIPAGHRLDRAAGTILEETQRLADQVRRLGRITRYETRGYVGSTRILDLERASEVDEEGEEA